MKRASAGKNGSSQSTRMLGPLRDIWTILLVWFAGSFVNSQKKGPLMRAERILGNILRTKPNNAIATLLMARTKFRLGKSLEAIVLYERFIEVNGTDARSLFEIGVLELQRDNFSAAIKYFQQAKSLDQNYAIEFNLGRAFENHGDLVNAAECYKQASMFEKAPPAVLVRLGFVMNSLGRLEEAHAAYEKALILLPEDFFVNVGLASTLLKSNDLDLAEKHYRKALAINPESPHARDGISEIIKRRSGGAQLN